jgi:hypothetical protein
MGGGFFSSSVFQQQQQAIPDVLVAHGGSPLVRGREIVMPFESHDPFEFSRFSVLMHFLASSLL